jgi:sporulation protein YabP
MGSKEEATLAVAHRLTLEGRGKLGVTGVTDVLSFDETAAVLETSRGTLIVRGSGLHVEQLNLEAGEVRVSGQVDSLTYEENARTQGSFLARLFR